MALPGRCRRYEWHGRPRRVRMAAPGHRRPPPAAVDDLRGADSHLKAYERAQEILRDLEAKLVQAARAHAAQAAVAPAAHSARTHAAQAVALRDPARAAASLGAACPAFGMPPADAPFAAAAFSGQPIAVGAATAEATLAAALLAAKTHQAPPSGSGSRTDPLFGAAHRPDREWGRPRASSSGRTWWWCWRRYLWWYWWRPSGHSDPDSGSHSCSWP